MLYEDKIKLLKAIKVLKQIPERQIAGLAEFLRPKELPDGGVVFLEGSLGMSLYFVSSGRIRISKGVSGGGFKELAILGPGEFFGETALIEEATRSATATAVGPSLVFELFRGDLSRWVKLNPQQAVQFFAELMNVQSMRLRRTSNELTLHTDLSTLLLEPGKAGADFMSQVLGRVTPYLEGGWSAAAFLKDKGSGPLHMAACCGEAKLEELGPKLPAEGADPASWIDDATFQVALTGQKGVLGRLLFQAKAPVGKGAKEEVCRTLSAVARLVATSLELQLARS
jgi:CRP-like cAMP-binding protein